MTLSELRSLCSFWLDDIQQSYFTPTQLNMFLNRALKEVQKYIVGSGQDYYQHCVQTTLVVNQRDYVLPEDFQKLNRLEVVISGTSPNETFSVVSPMTLNQKDQLFAFTGTPGNYYYKNNRLVLEPAPNLPLILRLVYVYIVADMENDYDVPDCPEQYHEMIAILAAIDAFIKDGRDASLLLTKKTEYLERMKQDVDERSIDQSRNVKESGNYADMDWNMF